MRSARRWATSGRSSRRTTAKLAAVKPCLREFRAERALPSGVRGPVEWDAFARLAANCFWETGLRERIGMELFLPIQLVARRQAGVCRREGQVAGKKRGYL